MNITISKSLAGLAAKLHAQRFFILGQSKSMEGYDLWASAHDCKEELAEANAVIAEGRKFDSQGVFFLAIARKELEVKP